jgi:hypothetical protein
MDWGTGSVTGDTSSCISYIGGIIQRCSDLTQFEASLTLYDARVLTKDGQPISVRGAPAAPAPASPAPSATPKPARPAPRT